MHVQDEIDRHFMASALLMAKRGLGTTAPNPAVGAVLVDDQGLVISRGYTQPGGRPHAEVMALQKAGEAARGSTLYVSLEPCSHWGKSPPCADALVEAGVRRVVCGLLDPDERVAGRGLQILRDAGLEVVENILVDEAHYVTLGHVLRVTQERPFVQLKQAVSKDGLIAPGDGHPVWVTGSQARARGHLLRARVDAILVGSGTMKADNPSLDCRLPGLKQRSPVKIIMDTHLITPAESIVLAGDKKAPPVWIIHGGTGSEKAKNKLLAKGAKLMEMPRNEQGFLGLHKVMNKCAESGITRLLVEGGPIISRAFLNAGLVDEVVLFTGRSELGSRGILPLVNEGIERITASNSFLEVDRRCVGEDKMVVYRNKKSMKAG